MIEYLKQTCRVYLLIFLMMTSVFAAENNLLIVALGDSTTAGTPGFTSPREAPPNGFGNPESQYAYWVMYAHPEWKVINQGVNAQRSDQILNRFDSDVTALHPDYVIVLAGVNDLYQGESSESVIKNLNAIYKKAKAQNIKIVACTILPFNDMPEEMLREMLTVNAWIAQKAKDEGFIFCDTYHLLEDPARPGNLISTPDGYHPDVTGYRKMGEWISQSIFSAL